MTSEELASQIRAQCVRLCHTHRASHIGGAFSVADILAVLYEHVLDLKPDQPHWPERDRLFYSKGHACTALYSTLEIKGFFAGLLADFTKDGSYFTSHVNHHVPGVELSTGSLGHALGVACGTALAGRRVGASWKVFALLSDGELDEGSNWEALLFAPQHKLDNLCVVVDYNKIQSFGSVTDVLELHPLPEKFRAFRWNCIEVDGHDHAALRRVFEDFKAGRVTGPLAIVCHTVKGKGVSFMEGQLLWHYRSPDAQQASAALQELGFDA